ncbi:MAG: peptidoglycan editing factor PgeF [Pseudomonadota bacterium]
MTPPRLTSCLLDKTGCAAHGFFGRAGGVSHGIYNSLNTGFGSDDAPENVAQNRARAAQTLGVSPDGLITAYQIHSAKAVVADAPWDRDRAPEADAIVTRRPGLALGALAADCIPVLFAAPDAGVIAAAHAGWRGALAGVLEATVEAMEAEGAVAADIRAAIGPCLRQSNFEVGTELLDAFTEKHPEAEQFFAPGVTENKRQLDLAGFAAWRLKAAGVGGVDDVAACTLGAPEDYFSYRHSRKTSAPDFGRNLSAIALKAA